MIRNKIFIAISALAVAGALFFSGYVTGKTQLNMPNTVIHHVTLKWKEGVSDADKQKALNGLKEIVADSAGAKALWIKPVKIQPDGYSQSFVIEFENEAALKAYANHPKKKEWDDFYYSIRESSYNCVTTN